jgi:hypothetical protein
MTDARQEDQERIVGQPIRANRVGRCAAAPVCKDKILVDDLIVEVDGSWVHAEGSCVDDLEIVLAERRAETDDRPWRVRVPGTIMADGLTEQEARERVEKLEASRPDDAFGHATMEQYDELEVCPTCGGAMDAGRAA